MTRDTGVSSAGVVTALRELIDAVDRRVPQLQRACEPRVALLAAALRIEAANRLEEMIRIDVDPDGPDTTLVEAVMTDDGGPTPADLSMHAATAAG
jgi:hypothetical protein